MQDKPENSKSAIGCFQAVLSPFQSEHNMLVTKVTGVLSCSFFFQAEDGIRDDLVTGVQTCALPLLFPYDADETALSSLLGRWVRRHHIDAILCNRGDLNALLATAGARGRVGVAFACLRLPDGSSQLAGVEANLRTVGVKAVSLLAAQLKSNHRGIPAFASTTYVQGHWKDGASAPRHHQRHA